MHTLRLIYHLPLRQAEGFLHALFVMMHLDLSAPDYTTLSRRGQHLQHRLRPVPSGKRIHLVLDSTGLSIFGEGEWAAAKYGRRGVLAPLSVGKVRLRRYGAVSYSQNSACDLCCVPNVA